MIRFPKSLSFQIGIHLQGLMVPDCINTYPLSSLVQLILPHLMSVTKTFFSLKSPTPQSRHTKRPRHHTRGFLSGSYTVGLSTPGLVDNAYTPEFIILSPSGFLPFSHLAWGRFNFSFTTYFRMMALSHTEDI